MAKDSLGKKLAFLSADVIDDPFGNEDAMPSPEIALHINSEQSSGDDFSAVQKKKKKNKFRSIIDSSNDFIDDHSDGLIYEFDQYLDGHLDDDENTDLKNSLIGLGRKYARENKTSAESSELSQAFSKNEKALDELYNDIQNDKKNIQKDIDSMRIMRTRNFKALADLVSAKNSYHTAALAVIKEKDNIKAKQFDIKIKSKKDEQTAGGDSTEVANKAIQGIFGLGRDNLIGSIGGYESVSGAIGSDDDPEAAMSINAEDNDEVIQAKYFKNREETDGDKFLKYEDEGVEYVLLIDENDHKQVIAENADGEIIPDYPMPSNVDNLNFNCDESIGVAEDDLHRRYKIRHI